MREPEAIEAQYERFTHITTRGFITVFAILAISLTSCAQAPGNMSDIDWLIEVLEIEEGSVVADIGAGDGDQTLAIARHIGPEGQIYSTELGSESVQELQEAIDEEGISNVNVIEGHPRRTNLPEECCDALYLRRVYHHFDDPESMNASLFQSLKPSGRIAVIDFEPRGSETDPEGRDSGSQHGVTAETVVSELKQAGFVLVSSDKASGRNIYVVMEKPEKEGE